MVLVLIVVGILLVSGCKCVPEVNTYLSTFNGKLLDDLSPAELETAWSMFNRYHGHSLSQQEHRQNLMDNIAHVLKHNAEYMQGKHYYKAGISKYSYMKPAEMLRKLNGYRPSMMAAHAKKSSNVLYVDHTMKELETNLSVDWRKRNVVTPVKDQGQCGSCYAFSATGAMEGSYAIANRKLVSLSEQQLVECSKGYGNMGCNGGLMDTCFEYIHDIEGIEQERDYPYHPSEDECTYNKSLVVTSVKEIVDIPNGDEDALEDAVYRHGPISVAIDVTNDFLFYQEGVFYDRDCSPEHLNHGVLVVGYGVEHINNERHQYWLVKNSWSDHWGDQGYIKMARNQSNMCGIATAASYPTM